MYFENVELFEYKKNIDNRDILYAHADADNKELLEEHMNLSMYYLNKVINEKNLDLVFNNIEKYLFKDMSMQTKNLYREMLYNVVYCHDLGKSNPDFQVMRMSNDLFKITQKRNSKHSLVSSVIYFNYYVIKLVKLEKEIKGDEFNLLFLLLMLNSYAISKHHGYLDDIAKYIIDLKKTFNDDEKPEFVNYINKNFNISKNILRKIDLIKTAEEIEQNQNWISVNIYIYSKVVFSMIVTCDFYSTSHFKNKSEIIDLGVIHDIENYTKVFSNTEVSKTIERCRREGINSVYENKDINKLRTEMYLESEINLLKNIDNDIFFLEAPTGSGKTNSAINLSLKLIQENKNLNKIFYVFPFNTLVEQTKKSLLDTFENSNKIKKNIAVINSITSIKTYDDEKTGSTIAIGENLSNKIDYEKSLLSRQFLHYPINIITHVKFFNILFGTDREAIFPLLHMANSVIVMDEIQSYRNSIWKEIIILIKAYAKLLNIRIIIMSATLPDLSLLSYDKDSFCNLINNRDKYYLDPLFKNRVELDYSLLVIDATEIECELLHRIQIEYEKAKLSPKLNGKVLVEFISKKTAINIYEELIKMSLEKGSDAGILLMTGYDSKFERQKIIDRVNNGENIILIATQVIEAGVDIDMDIGFKDISILDSEEQFLGRINRSCKKKGCKVYFFNMDDSSKIYKDDVRNLTEITLVDKDIMEILKNKNFDIYYKRVIQEIENSKHKLTDKSIETFRMDTLNHFSFSEIEMHMELINQKNKYTIFLNTQIKLEDGKILSGKSIWNEYNDILRDKHLKFAEKKIKLSQVSEWMDYFTYEVDKISFSYNDRIGDLIYIEDGEKYLLGGKFNVDLLRQTNLFEIL